MNFPQLKKVLVGAAFALTSVFASAQTIELKMHSQIAESRPEAQHLKAFAEDVARRSGGRLKINVFHAGSLGLKDADLLRILKAGAVDMAMLYGEYFTRDAPELGVVYVQGAIRKPEDHLALLPTMRTIYEEGYEAWGIRSVGGVVSPVFNVGIHCKEPIRTLDGLKGKKLRVWAAHLVDTFQDLGIAGQVIPQNSMYMALQTGVIDCAYYLLTVAKTVSLHEVAKYEAYLHPWAAVPWMFGISDKAWSRLPQDLQVVLKEAGEAMWETTRAAAVDPAREQAAIEERKALGITMLEPFSEADVSRFIAASEKAWLALAESAGPKGVENYRRMKEAIAKLEP